MAATPRCVVTVMVAAARNLPVMDLSSDSTDAYVEIKLGNDDTHQTAICRKTLDPVWNHEVSFPVADLTVLHDYPLELRVWDYNRMSDNMIGSVCIELHDLLLETQQYRNHIAGWFTLYDTLDGARGQLKVVVTLQCRGRAHMARAREAPRVSFFSTSRPPGELRVVRLLGFVEEMIRHDDPQSHWADNFRHERNSNEARQSALYHLSGQLQRLIAVKVAQMGGNAVLALREMLSVEEKNTTGLVLSAHGTAAVITSDAPPDDADSDDRCSPQSPSPALSHSGPRPLPTVAPALPASPGGGSHQSGASADTLGRFRPPSLPHQKNPGSTSPDKKRANAAPGLTGSLGPPAPKEALYANLEREVQLLSMDAFPKGVVRAFSGLVKATSVKLLTVKGADLSARNEWWNEIREEIRTHARSLGCFFVVGYTETRTVFEDICVLSASGSAVVMNLRHQFFKGTVNVASGKPMKRSKRRKKRAKCAVCHFVKAVPNQVYPTSSVTCADCERATVPSVLYSTLEPPPWLPVVGPGVLVEARVVKPKKRAAGRHNAVVVSDLLPFLEHQLNRQLSDKLKILGRNAAFGLRFTVVVGDSTLIGIASGTALFLSPLPPPSTIAVSRSLAAVDADEDAKSQSMSQLARVQRLIEAQSKHHRDLLAAAAEALDTVSLSISSDTDMDGTGSSGSSSSTSTRSIEAQGPALVEVDDAFDEDSMAVLLDPAMPPGFAMAPTESLGHTTQAAQERAVRESTLITTVKLANFEGWKAQQINQAFAAAMHGLYATLAYRLMKMRPVTLLGVRTDVAMLENTSFMIVATAMALREASTAVPVAPPPEVPWLVPRALVPPLALDAEKPGHEDVGGVFKMDLAEEGRAAAAAEEARAAAAAVAAGPSGGTGSPKRDANVFASAPPGALAGVSANSSPPSRSKSVGAFAAAAAAAAAAGGSGPVRAATVLSSVGGPRPTSVFASAGAGGLGLIGLGLSAGLPVAPRPLGLTELVIPTECEHVTITPLARVFPGEASRTTYVGHVTVFLIREVLDVEVDGNAGLGRVMHGVLSELHAVLRGRVAGRGGNALIGYRLHKCLVLLNDSKTEAYCVLHASGDAVSVTSITSAQPTPIRRAAPG